MIGSGVQFCIKRCCKLQKTSENCCRCICSNNFNGNVFRQLVTTFAQRESCKWKNLAAMQFVDDQMDDEIAAGNLINVAKDNDSEITTWKSSTDYDVRVSGMTIQNEVTVWRILQYENEVNIAYNDSQMVRKLT